MGHVYKSLLGLGLAATAVFSLTTAAEARRCKGHSCKDSGVYRHINVESNYGSRRVVVPVRHTRLGDQVKLPGGSWVDCEVTCEYTVRRLSVEPPAHLLDTLWLPAELEDAAGTTATVHLPVLYAGSGSSDDDSVRLGRETRWEEVAPDLLSGRGQRLLVHAAGDELKEVPLLELRTLEIADA